jgi:D-alanyl-lipoteichoic acid acyltransferase DltB (MBOAT superfamily)
VKADEADLRSGSSGGAASVDAPTSYHPASDKYPDGLGASLPAPSLGMRALSLAVLAAGVGALGIALAWDYISGGYGGFGHRQMALAVVGLGVIAWGTELWTASGIQALRVWLATVRQMPWSRAGALALIAAQLALVVYVMREVRLENQMLWNVVAILAAAGFLVNLLIPPRTRLPFFAALSLLGVYVVFGAVDGAWLATTGLLLIALCHLPLPYRWRVALVLLAGGALVAMRADWMTAPWSGIVWPILGSMFMFRLMVYLYDLRHSKEPMGVARSISYFFLLPNLVFPLFPVVDFATFRRTYYDRDDLVIYEEGVQWMARGIVHLLLYRIVYQYLVLAPEQVESTATLVQYMVANFLLYLRVSGQFHLIVGMLHLFGFRLPETHRFFYLASSFTDFWRRINIYWKDFMMKLFYYPAYFRLKKHTSETTTLVLATLLVFAGTWFLHAYQWFWILGKFLLSWTDAAFWAVLGIVLVASSLYEVKHGRTRSLTRKQWTARDISMHALRVTGTFIFICVLWSVWTSHTFGAWFAMLGASNATGLGLAAAVGGVFLVAFVSTAILNRRLTTTAALPAQQRRVLGPGVLAAVVPMVLVALVVQPTFTSGLPISAQQALHNVRLAELNRRDAALLQQGYYENLNANNFSSQLWDVYAAKPKDWAFVWQTGAADFRATFQRVHLLPSASVLFNGQPLTTNRHAMRDREYSLAKPEGVLRIALLGPSYVMGDGVGDDDVFDNLVEDRLNRERTPELPRIEILNFAISALAPTQQLYLLEEKVSAFDPDIVILVSEKQNDLEASEHLGALQREEIAIPYGFIREIAERTGVQPWVTKEEAYRQTAPFAEELVEKTYAALGAAAQARGYRPYWLYLPMPQRLETREEVESLFLWAEAGGMETLDLVELWRGRDLSVLRVAPWDRHPNAAGHRIMADAFYDIIMASGMLERRPQGGDRDRIEPASIDISITNGGAPATEGM